MSWGTWGKRKGMRSKPEIFRRSSGDVYSYITPTLLLLYSYITPTPWQRFGLEGSPYGRREKEKTRG
jgi:hypothetical protein